MKLKFFTMELPGAGWSYRKFLAVGQGGGLLVKDADRDTERFALKPSSQKRQYEKGNKLYGLDVVKKNPLEVAKRSKAGTVEGC